MEWGILTPVVDGLERHLFGGDDDDDDDNDTDDTDAGAADADGGASGAD
jgi:hypothetical protein